MLALVPALVGVSRTLAKRSFTKLRRSDGSVVAGACVIRVSDGRMAVIAEDLDRVAANSTCAQGDVLAAAARAATGRGHPLATYW